MDIALSIMIGLCLAACCGFRVFVPLLVLAIAAKAGAVALDPGLAWIASTPALIAFSIATVAEIVAYKVPWVDNALDTIATPAAIVAGTLVAASQFTFIGQQGQLLKWTCAIIAGGGIAAGVQALTVGTRALSTTFTGGLLNPVVATAESGAAVTVSILSVLVPILAALILLTSLGFVAFLITRRFRARQPLTQPIVG